MVKFPKQSSVYWFDPEPVRGSEFRKVRPCVVVSPDEMNENLKTVIITPLTSTIKPWPFRLAVKLFGQKSSIACDQIRTIDKHRLKAYVGQLNNNDSYELFKLLKTIFSKA